MEKRTPRKFIRLREVQEKTGLSRSTIYKFISENRFPKQIKLGQKASAWILEEVESWMENRIERSRTA